MRVHKSPTLINWVLREFMGCLKDQKLAIHECLITPEKLAHLVALIDQGKISNRAAQEVFAEMLKTGEEPGDLVKRMGLEQLENREELEALVKKLIADNPGQVAGYRSGKTKLFGFFVGQAMALTQGRGNPNVFSRPSIALYSRLIR
jgi:aspartyl-tRNA(Asn)/glutamyl-tRNA(Gln) amidotransferase subunit B